MMPPHDHKKREMGIVPHSSAKRGEEREREREKGGRKRIKTEKHTK